MHKHFNGVDMVTALSIILALLPHLTLQAIMVRVIPGQQAAVFIVVLTFGLMEIRMLHWLRHSKVKSKI